MFNMIEKRTLLLKITIILCCQTVLCGQFRQIDLNPSEIDPNVSPLHNRPNKPELINNNNNNIDLLSGITTDTTQATTLPPTSLVDDIILDSNVESNPSGSTTARPPIIIPIAPNVDDQKPIDKFCKCTETVCNCCRDFSLPLIPIRGPGCAKIQYLGDERMSVQIKYGDIVLASRTINGKKAAPVCVGLPGGYNRFCARFYGLSKEKSGFKSCMSLELRAEDDVEAQLRVSCFKFGKKGFSVTEAEPIPQIETEKDDEDDDDDFFGLGGGDDDEDADEPDDDDDDDDEPVGASAGTDDDSADYDFRFIEEIFDTDDDSKNEKFTSVTQRATTSPLISYNEPQTKESSMNNNNNDDSNINNNNNNNNNTHDESVIVPQKNLKKNKKKKKHDEDDFDITDILYGILNLF